MGRTGGGVSVPVRVVGTGWFPDHDFPVANHVVVALDLAEDRGRVREILEGGIRKATFVSGEILLLDGPVRPVSVSLGDAGQEIVYQGAERSGDRSFRPAAACCSDRHQHTLG